MNKKRYDPHLGKYVYQNVYGEGVFDSIKKILGKTAKKATTAAAKKATTVAAKKATDAFKKTTTPNKAGKQIVELLRKDKIPLSTNERVNQLLST